MELQDVKLTRQSPPGNAYPEVVETLDSFDEWPRSDALSRLGLEQLNTHLKASSNLCNSIDEWLEKHGLSSGEPAENFRPFSQNTKEEFQNVEEPSAVDNSARCKEVAESELPSLPHCPASLTLTPENLYANAGDSLRLMLDAGRDPNRPLRERDIIEAACVLLPMLDIHPSVWFEGQSTLGDHGLALCLLLVDVGRDHPTFRISFCSRPNSSGATLNFRSLVFGIAQFQLETAFKLD